MRDPPVGHPASTGIRNPDPWIEAVNREMQDGHKQPSIGIPCLEREPLERVEGDAGYR